LCIDYGKKDSQLFIQQPIFCGVINWKPMKLFLLLAAIYSLIIHQSNKNAKEKEMATKKAITKEISLQIDSNKKQIVPPGSAYATVKYMSGGNNSNVYAKWGNKE
jgi:hypothetical protein